MEWLGEWDEEGATEPDEDFYVEDDPDKSLRGRLYLVMFNQQAMAQLISLWDRYRRNPNEKFDRGLNKLEGLFGRLRDLRFWDETDRMDDVLQRNWEEQLAEDRQRLIFKASCGTAPPPKSEMQTEAIVEELVREEGGRFGQTAISEIAFHAIAGDFRPEAARRSSNL